MVQVLECAVLIACGFEVFNFHALLFEHFNGDMGSGPSVDGALDRRGGTAADVIFDAVGSLEVLWPLLASLKGEVS